MGVEAYGPPFGSPEHAAEETAGRHPGIRDGLQWLVFTHLPPDLQRFSLPFYQAGVGAIRSIQLDSPELTTAINRLIEAKDSAVRAGIRQTAGRAGPVLRPGIVVDPPALAPEAGGDDGS